MSSDLLAIARSGTRAARAALDLTAQNIANADSEGYVRRSVSLSEVSGTGGPRGGGALLLSGVAVGGVTRNVDTFRQAEVRRTGSDAARASAEVDGLESIENAVEQGGLYDASVKFEGGLQQLASDPTNGSLRAAVLESAGTLASAFDVTSKSLDAVGQGMRFEAQGGVDQVNQIAGELARINGQLAKTANAGGDQSALLDKRDTLLQQLSEHVDVTTKLSSNNTVEVRLGGAEGPQLVAGGAVGTMAMTGAIDGTIGFTLDGKAVTPSAGALAGKGQALVQLAGTRSRIDAVAASVIGTVNAAQANGVDLDGKAGQPLLSGTKASDIAVITRDGTKLATAPAGAEAKSRDAGNLATLRTGLAGANPSGALDATLFEISSAVSSRTLTRDALNAIADTATSALQAQSGVDLDEEAVNLIRFQQAFQASGRVMQVANDLFDTLLNIR
jgi:flagellar hook-associated protein 1 FlgK